MSLTTSSAPLSPSQYHVTTSPFNRESILIRDDQTQVSQNSSFDLDWLTNDDNSWRRTMEKN